jgi:hypothetical protein
MNDSGSIQNSYSSFSGLQGVSTVPANLSVSSLYVATATLRPNDLNGIVLLGQTAAAATLTIPDAKSCSGKRFSVRCQVTGAGGNTMTITFPAGTISGLIASDGNSAAAGYTKPLLINARDSIIFANTRLIGDGFDVFCDGTVFHVSGLGTRLVNSGAAVVTLA